ncbi:MAG: DegT/DnrJ/EryC1/StrS family aminotransferase, partial [Candidatus Hydrogenedentes bacterium]|nr:DegT/DnrJ/EryC1/StrS family aminotransferase [Candidatus Hydrogenedentota bacterium]
EIVTPKTLPGNEHVWHQYVVRLPRRDEAKAFLKERGIDSGIFYPLPLHQQKCFAHLPSAAAKCPEAERASREVLALPIYPELTDDQVGEVVDVLQSFLAL